MLDSAMEYYTEYKEEGFFLFSHKNCIKVEPKM